jgi:hypothetical protein
MDITDTRQHVHNLVDQLPPAQLAALEGLLATMVDPVARGIAASPVDDEPITEEEAAILRRSEEWFRHNKGIPMEEVLAEFGLSMKDFPLEKHGD